MSKFNIVKTDNLNEASQILAQEGTNAEIIAGCTDVIVKFRNGKKLPNKAISLKRINELNYIKDDKDNVYIGATSLLSNISKHNIIVDNFPALSDAAGQVGSPLIRNTATIGGNICNASPAADTAPPLLVYKSKVKIFNQGNERTVNLSDFFVGPGKTILKPGDIVTEFILPKNDDKRVSKFYKQGRRKALEISIVNFAASLTVNDYGTITDAVVACGAVAPTPIVLKKTSEHLIGMQISEKKDLEFIVESIRNEIKPITDIRSSANYRKHMAGIIGKRVIGELTGVKEIYEETVEVLAEA